MFPGIRKVVVVCGVVVTVFMAGSVWAEYRTPDLNNLPDNKKSSLQLYLTAPQAFEKKSALRGKALLLDIRTQAEIQFVGWADISDGQTVIFPTKSCRTVSGTKKRKSSS